MLINTSASKERRYSHRWSSRRQLQWRVRRGRKPRAARILERSLNGLVLSVSSYEAPAEGEFVLPADVQMGDRHGFREAIVRRANHEGDLCVLFLEILA